MSCLEPPYEFKDKRQIRQLMLTRQREENGEEKKSFHVSFQKKQQDVVEEAENLRKFRKAANFVKQIVSIEKYTSFHPEDWHEEVQAGVRIWVNKMTGEVADECPWMLALHQNLRTPSHSNCGSPRLVKPHLSSNLRSATTSNLSSPTAGALSAHATPTHSHLQHSETQGILMHNLHAQHARTATPVDQLAIGTGALVYDGSEIDEFFNMLDQEKMKMDREKERARRAENRSS